MVMGIVSVSATADTIKKDNIVIKSTPITSSIGLEIAHYGIPLIGGLSKVGGIVYGPRTIEGTVGKGPGIGLIIDETEDGIPSSVSEEYSPIGFARSNLISSDSVSTTLNFSDAGIANGEKFTAVVKMAAAEATKQSNTQNLQTFLDSGYEYYSEQTIKDGLVGGINLGEGKESKMLSTKEFDDLTTYIDPTYGFEYKRVSIEATATEASTKICGRNATTVFNAYTGLVIFYGFEVYNSQGVKVWEKSVNDLYHEDLNSFFGTEYGAYWVCESGYEWKNKKGSIYGTTTKQNNKHITYATDYVAEFTLNISNILDENEKIATIGIGDVTRDLYKSDVQEGYSIYRIGCYQSSTEIPVSISVTENADIKLSNITVCKTSNADSVISLIDSISNLVSTKSETSINAARSAYNKLNDNNKDKVTNYTKLTDCETALSTLQNTPHIDKINQTVDAINDIDEITVYNLIEKESLLKTIRNYLSDLNTLIGKNNYSLSNIGRYNAAEEKYSLLSEIYPVAQKIISLPFGKDFTLDNEDALNNAVADFNKLTGEQQSRFPSELISKLNGLVELAITLKTNYTLGNVNCDSDNNIESSDALMALQCSVKKITLDHNQALAADVNCDGEISASDALSILQCSVKKISNFDALNVFEANGPKGIVYSYNDDAKKFLESGLNEATLKYKSSVKNPDVPTTFNFVNNTKDIEKMTLIYSTDPGYCNNVISVDLEPSQTSVDVYNLYKASDYYWKLIATRSNGSIIKRTGTFTTTDLGPRVLKIDGIYNTRNIGGYLTDDGKRTKQGMIYRGGSFTPDAGYTPNITEDGIDTLTNLLGVKTEIDFRGTDLLNPPDVSAVPGVNLIYATMSGLPAQEMKKVFTILADESNYPIYVHCTAGADRTGSVVSIINGLLGVGEMDLRADFAFTTYSVYGYRSSDGCGANFAQFGGNTIKENAERWLAKCGITKDQIETIRSILIEGYEKDVD